MILLLNYFNLINSRVIDLTSKQFKNKLDYSNYQIVTREQLLNNLDTKERHEKMILYKKYSPDEYPTYFNFDGIDINKSSEIPV